MRKAIGLVRVSTDSQGAEDRGGIAAQRREIERIAEREELEVVGVVELCGVSGTEVREDPRFISLLSRLSEPSIAGVIAADADRLFRRKKFSDYGILDSFADTGSVLYTSQGAMDPRQESDALLSVLRGELAGMERKRIAERTMRAKEIHRRAGRHVAGYIALPYGVTYSKTDGWGFDPAAVLVVQEAYAAVLAGERNMAALARRLGIGRTLVNRILRATVYKGLRRIDRRYPGKKAVPRPAEGVIEFTLPCPAPISEADWQAVQDILGSRSRAPRSEMPYGRSRLRSHGDWS